MLTLSTKVSPTSALPLGTIIDVQVARARPDVETRIFLRHPPIFYPQPLRDWSDTDEAMLLFPESPGEYSVEVQWRAGDERGTSLLDFTVVAEQGPGAVPTRVQLGEISLWVPSAFEARAFSDNDREVGALLRRLVGPGETVYDLGANVGFYASHFSRLVGSGGRVVCFEANPICIQLLRTNVLELGLTNTVILPVAALHLNGMTHFMVNYGNSNLGLSEASGFYRFKPGQPIAVACYTIDHLVREFELPPPDLVKIDVEGAETLVLDGMEETLARHRPKLLLEIHGSSCARVALGSLATQGYTFEDPASGHAAVSAEQAVERYAEAVFQIVARPSS